MLGNLLRGLPKRFFTGRGDRKLLFNESFPIGFYRYLYWFAVFTAFLAVILFFLIGIIKAKILLLPGMNSEYYPDAFDFLRSLARLDAQQLLVLGIGILIIGITYLFSRTEAARARGATITIIGMGFVFNGAATAWFSLEIATLRAPSPISWVFFNIPFVYAAMVLHINYACKLQDFLDKFHIPDFPRIKDSEDVPFAGLRG